MGDISIKEYKLYSLDCEYNQYASYIVNFQDHIDRCIQDGIIHPKKRYDMLKTLNRILKTLNVTYNELVTPIDNDESGGEHKITELFPIALKHNKQSSSTPNASSVGTFQEVRRLGKICQMLEIDTSTDMLINPFQNVKEKLIKLGSKIGFNTIDDALSLIVGEQYKELYKKSALDQITTYNQIFIPVEWDTTKTSAEDTVVVTKVQHSYEYISLVDNFVQIQIEHIGNTNNLDNNNTDNTDNTSNEDNTKPTYINLRGYFKMDPLGAIIKTSIICNSFIYDKNKALEEAIEPLKKTISPRFCKEYFKNTNIADIVSLSPDKYKRQLVGDWKMHNDIVNKSFPVILNRYNRNDDSEPLDIQHLYKIIKLMLLGSEESIKNAGILFKTTMENRPTTTLTVADIIYNNLSYTHQALIKRSFTTIKNELKKIKSTTISSVDFHDQLLACDNMPDQVKRMVLDKIDEMKSMDGDHYKHQLYIKTVLKFPWPGNDDCYADIRTNDEECQKYLDNMLDKLNEKVYGHTDFKNTIKEIVAEWIANPKGRGKALGLVGPPGIGKTLMAKAIGECLGLRFQKITLGGQNDGSILKGHSFTYSSAQPGMIIKKMCEAGQARCIIYIDELDKACKRSGSNELQNILMNALDENMNSAFFDNFCHDIPFSLKDVLWLVAYNKREDVDPILLERIEETFFKAFKIYDKRHIVRKHIIPEMKELLNIKTNIEISDKNIDFIVDRYTSEAGVRDLKNKFHKIFRKLNIERIYKTGIYTNRSRNVKKITLTRDTIIRYLSKEYITIDTIHKESMVGVINGLYCTDTGDGGILPIQIYINYIDSDGKFVLKMTGSQKRVTQESVTTACTASISGLDDDIRTEFLRTHQNGFHVHMTDGATPKDGPSAGVAFATAFMSRMLNKKIRNDIAMTGEIELTGRVKKIGGLNYKLTGAKRAGVKTVLVPRENKDDLDKIKAENPDLFKGGFKVVMVDHIDDVIKLALI
jgi:endopeptidase La